MWPTVEVRWFYRGTIPPAVYNWFHQDGHQAETPLSRTDYYLHLVDGDFLGVKLREGRVEIKQRHHQYGVVQFHGRVAGQVEQWRKWSFPLAEDNHIIIALKMFAPFWTEVHKTRQQRGYQVIHKNRVVARPTEAMSQQGCNLELTAIRAAGNEWWTLSYEAFGDEATIQENLLRVAKHLFTKNTPPNLQAKDSYSYPAWLKRIRPC